MITTMTFDIGQGEDFFGAKFELIDPSLSQMREITCFDGYAHWRVWFKEETQMLFFTSDKDIYQNAFPTLEIGIFCSDSEVSTFFTAGEIELILHPKGSAHSHNLLVITKTKEGRFSLATTLGEIPDD